MTIREAITRLEECVDRCIAPEEYCQCVDFLEQQKRLAPFVPRIAWWDAMRLSVYEVRIEQGVLYDVDRFTGELYAVEDAVRDESGEFFVYEDPDRESHGELYFRTNNPREVIRVFYAPTRTEIFKEAFNKSFCLSWLEFLDRKAREQKGGTETNGS